MLPPPVEGNGKVEAAMKPQTEADKVLQRYEDLGKQQEHAYGAIGSGVPNFNLKPPGAQAAALTGAEVPDGGVKAAAPTESTATDQKPAPAAKEPSKPAVATIPSVLGARPEKRAALSGTGGVASPAKATVPEGQPKSSGPVLPLGAPRKKASATPPPPQ